MKSEPLKEVLNELFSHLERLETQSEAILQFLKERRRVTDKQLAPYLEQAGNASNVRWRAARLRMEHLLAPEQEAKADKQPELHKELSRQEASGEKDKFVPAEAAQARPADARQERPEEKSGAGRENKEQAPEAGREEKSDHPSEITATGVEQAARVSSKEKDKDQEAA